MMGRETRISATLRYKWHISKINLQWKVHETNTDKILRELRRWQCVPMRIPHQEGKKGNVLGEEGVGLEERCASAVPQHQT